jgi:multidrug efflux pump subunit AcrB
VLITAPSVGFALLPLMIEVRPAKAIVHPANIVIFGGLITSTLLDTLLNPSFF